MTRLFGSRYFLYTLFIVVTIGMGREFIGALSARSNLKFTFLTDTTWHAPSLFLEAEPAGEQRELLIYGEELIANTSRYFGPKGKISPISNGMNCQNCHL